MVSTIEEWKRDIWGLTETNIIWHNVSTKNQWKERTRKYNPMQSCFAYNKHESMGTDKFLPGGVGQVVASNMAGRTIENGKDESGLGRWIWQKFQGRFGFVIRVITFYRPCNGETQDVESSLSTISQHRRFFKDFSIDPRQKFLTDLRSFIAECIKNNEKIVVMGDLNDDVRSTNTFSSLGMHECITSKFPHPPPT